MTVTVSDIFKTLVLLSDQLAITVLPCLSSIVVVIVFPKSRIVTRQFAVVPLKDKLGVITAAFVAAFTIMIKLSNKITARHKTIILRLIVSPPFTNKTRERGRFAQGFVKLILFLCFHQNQALSYVQHVLLLKISVDSKDDTILNPY